MSAIRIVASVIFLAFAFPAYSQEGDSGKPPATQPRNTSPATDIKNAFIGIGHGIRDGAHQFRRSVAVARCNNGEYSYTHHKTCNHNGGVREQLR